LGSCRFFWVSDEYVPTGDGKADNVIISQTFDPSSHFESATHDIIDMHVRATGAMPDLSGKVPEDLQNTDDQQ